MERNKNGSDLLAESGEKTGRKTSSLLGRFVANKEQSNFGREGSAGGPEECNMLTDALLMPQNVNLGSQCESPIDNVRRLLESNGCCECSSMGEHSQTDHSHRNALFCEMLYLNTELAERVVESGEGSAETAASPMALANIQQTLFWQQTHRWIKLEQCVEGAGTRLSKPYISLLSIYPLLQLKHCFRRGVVLLESGANSFIRLCDLLVDEWTHSGQLGEDMANLVKDIIYAPKLHLNQGKLRKVNESNGYFRNASYATDSMQSGVHLSASSSSGSSTENTRHENADERLLKKLPPNVESAALLVANVSALDRPLSAFVRLKYPTLLHPELPDHPIPVRFIYVLLNPMDNYPNETINIGRAMGALLSDEIFQSVAFHCLERHTLSDAVDEFLSQIVLIPPGNCSLETRWKPADRDAGGATVRHVGMLYANYTQSVDELPSSFAPFVPSEYSTSTKEAAAASRHLQLAHLNADARPYRTGRLFGGLMADIRCKLPWFPSDFSDFFRGRLSQSLAATILLFFANLSNIITFGAIMERGQPLNVLSATGPTLIFEKILFDFCTTNHWEFLPFRFYVGLWMCFYLIILVATDASALVALITRFTEEAFATLISIVFIIQAFEKLFEISYEAPITRQPQEVLHSACYCIIQTEELRPFFPFSWNSTVYKNLSVGVSRCHELGGEPQGLQCYFKPDVYMFSIILTFGTFLIAFSLNGFRRSRYFSFRFRNLISDFGVLIAIVSFTLLTYLIGLEVPSLKVPASIRPTMDREWIVDFTNIEGYHVVLIASMPALFYTILVMMDQQITAVIINRKDNKLKKGGGYHLDLLIISLLVLICSFLGLPFYVAATVLSVMHVESLKENGDCTVPGERQKLLGVKEQRLSAILSHIFIGCSVFLTPLVKVVPLPVLTGIFLYMGVVSLIGQQFVQRIALLFMPVKYQPDYVWLRNVPTKRIHTFTSIQLLSIGILFAVKYSSTTLSMLFPLMLVFTVLIRMLLLSRIFTPKELKALDDELPQFGEVIRVRSNRPIHLPPNGNGGEAEEEPLRGEEEERKRTGEGENAEKERQTEKKTEEKRTNGE
ncbi:hypothetical protein niasHS_013453 [Heterodera schachtii]|uniref:Anion exchange protein n=1 Tax=Heterodera schachtii TaxID=97005 RepID=A0ABD2ICA6_HETSC